MKVIILCAGYGTRLIKSIENDESNIYSHIKGIAKPLLPINGIPLISYWLETFSKCEQVTEIIIVSNEAHRKSYEDSAFSVSNIISFKIMSDGSTCNENRTGAVNCMLLGAGDSKNDCLFVAGDTLLDKDFILTEFIEKFEKLKMKRNFSCLLLSAPVEEKDVAKHGIIEVNEDNRVTSFMEKPQPCETTSRLQSPCFYAMTADSLHYIMDFMNIQKSAPLSEKDATGKFIRYLVPKSGVFAHQVSQRFDIGNLDSYIECCKNFQGFN